MLLFPFLVGSSSAQTPFVNFRKLDSLNGSPLGKINAISQDPKGIMWFCGSDKQCLYRYDGTTLTSFKQEPNNPNSVGFYSLESIFADKLGYIWIGGEGLDRYDPSSGIFRHYTNPTIVKGKNWEVSTIFRDSKKNVWVGTFHGLFRVDEASGKVIPYLNDSSNPRSLSDNVVNVIYEDKRASLWVGTGFPWAEDGHQGGLNQLNPDGSFTRYQHDPRNPKSLLNNKVRALMEDSRGNFWVGTGDVGLHIMNREKGTFDRYPFDPRHPDQLSAPPMNRYNRADYITFIEEDKTGAIWVGSYLEGLSRYDRLTRRMTRYRTGNGYPDSSTFRGYVSSDGVIWVASDYSPVLYRADPTPQPLTYIPCGTWVNRLVAGHGHIWAATNNGLMQFDQRGTLQRRFRYNPRDHSGISSDTVHTLYQDPRSDTIWMGTEKGVDQLDAAHGTFTQYTFQAQRDAVGVHPNPILLDKDDNLWMVTADGLSRYNRKNGSLKKWAPDPSDSGSLGSTSISFLFQDRAGQIWAGTWRDKQGIWRLDGKTEKFHRYLSGSSGRNMFRDRDGVLWATTWNGLFRYDDRKDDFFPFFEPESGLHGIHAAGIEEDRQGNLWVSTVLGLVKINQARDNSILYGDKFGVHQGDVFVGITDKTTDGQILAVNEKGYYLVHPEDHQEEGKGLNLFISDLLLNHASGKQEMDSTIIASVNNKAEITLAHDQNNFGLRFMAKDHYTPEPIRYFTMLENYDPVWRKTGADQTVYYFNLAPGDYVFRIRAYDSNETRSEKQLRIHVAPPWWNTWWAYVFYALILSLIGFALYRYQRQRIISLEREKARQFELTQAKEIEKAYHELRSTQAQLVQSEKMASLGELTAGIAHEIQNPLNFVNNFSQVSSELLDEMKEELGKGKIDDALSIADDLGKNLEKINHHGERAGSIVKSMLQHSRTSSGQKEPTDINALAEEYLRLAYHGFRAKDNFFEAKLHTHFEETAVKVNVIPQDIGRVLLNLYNNAFYAVSEKKKTGLKGYEPTVSVSTRMASGMLEIMVSDNGAGIPDKIRSKVFQPFFTTKPTGDGTGLGLSLSYDIVKANGGEIQLESIEGEGTFFKVLLSVA